MFCKNRGIDFSVSLCRVYAREICAQHLWGFPLYHPALFGISTLPPGTLKDSHFTTRWLDGKRTLSNASTAIENQTFGAGVTK